MSTRNMMSDGCGLLLASAAWSAASAQSAASPYRFGSLLAPQSWRNTSQSRRMAADCRRGAEMRRPAPRSLPRTVPPVMATSCRAIPTRALAATVCSGARHAATKTPVKTVESYWPYATTLYDYVKRAMPFSAPGSLSDDEVYAVVAYILSEAKIIKSTETMDAKTLPKVVMPNEDGFIADSRPELELYR